MSVQVKGSVKATVVDGSGNILYRGQQKVDFESSATHQVFATNMGLTRDEEIVESIDYQRIQVAQQAIHVSREQADLLVASGPYAPRFVLFTPSIPELAFPQPSYRATGIITSDTEAELHLELENASGGYDDEHIGMIKLERPSEDSKAQLMLPVEASNYPSLNIMGGSPFAMGVDFNHGNQTLPGIYIVRITLFDGAMAQSHLIVRPPDEESTPVPSTMAPTTISSESQAPLVPSTMVPTTISSESQAPSSMAAETDSPTNVTPTSSPLPQNSSSIAPTSLPTLSPTTMKPTSFPSKSPVQTASKASLTPRSPARDIGFLWIGAAAGATVLLVLFYFGLNRPKRQGNDMTDQNNNQAKEPHGSINSRDSSAV